MNKGRTVRTKSAGKCNNHQNVELTTKACRISDVTEWAVKVDIRHPPNRGVNPGTNCLTNGQHVYCREKASPCINITAKLTRKAYKSYSDTTRPDMLKFYKMENGR